MIYSYSTWLWLMRQGSALCFIISLVTVSNSLPAELWKSRLKSWIKTRWTWRQENSKQARDKGRNKASKNSKPTTVKARKRKKMIIFLNKVVSMKTHIDIQATIGFTRSQMISVLNKKTKMWSSISLFLFLTLAVEWMNRWRKHALHCLAILNLRKISIKVEWVLDWLQQISFVKLSRVNLI